ncbi:vitamin K epoxide reductase family protein [Chryseobacterium sp. MYb328]|uniref:vitamin K epoxide reductase family protein n=1 Tax=Chryseobacterium sp. MYb328 TaxID=2745231 RepID=UPI0030B2C389
MSVEQNLEPFILYLKNQNISINFSEFKIQIETHPDYPSLLAFSDTLTFFNIPNLATKIYTNEFDDLPDSFIALLQEEQKAPFFSFLEYKEGLYQYTVGDEKKKGTLQEIDKLWKNVVLLIEKPEDFIDTKPNNGIMQSLLIGGLVMAILGITYLFSSSLLVVSFGALSLLGIFFSFEALKTELGLSSKISQTFCSAMANADCKQVINSNKISWLKYFKISDISIWFFISQVLNLLLFVVAGASTVFLSYMMVVLVLSIPMTLYSIYFQYAIEKKWCPVCLTIIGIVYLQTTLIFTELPQLFFKIELLSLFIFVFLLIAALVYYSKPYFIEKKEIQEEYIRQLRFSRNYEIFRNNLKSSKIEFFNKDLIILGRSNTSKRITVVTSPFCGFCQDVHEALEGVLERYSEQISISIRFNLYEEAMDDNTKNLLIRLVEVYNNGGDLIFIEALNTWFKNNDFNAWFLKYGKPQNVSMIKSHLNEITKENLAKGLSFTPNIFLNQYNYPKHYKREDLEYFIADWIEDEGL